MTTETKSRTITLTGRAPVKIDPSKWPEIATAVDDSYKGNDYCRRNQALIQGELDEYTVRVRQHEDGRAIVYAVFEAATAWTGNESHRGGELLQAGDDIPAAIRRVGEECGIPDSVIRDCIADLPAVVLE